MKNSIPLNFNQQSIQVQNSSIALHYSRTSYITLTVICSLLATVGFMFVFGLSISGFSLSHHPFMLFFTSCSLLMLAIVFYSLATVKPEGYVQGNCNLFEMATQYYKEEGPADKAFMEEINQQLIWLKDAEKAQHQQPLERKNSNTGWSATNNADVLHDFDLGRTFLTANFNFSEN